MKNERARTCKADLGSYSASKFQRTTGPAYVAKRIVGLVKEGGRITGYQLSDNSIVEKQQAVNMAKQGQIAGVGIAHRGDEYVAAVEHPWPGMLYTLVAGN